MLFHFDSDQIDGYLIRCSKFLNICTGLFTALLVSQIWSPCNIKTSFYLLLMAEALMTCHTLTKELEKDIRSSSSNGLEYLNSLLAQTEKPCLTKAHHETTWAGTGKPTLVQSVQPENGFRREPEVHCNAKQSRKPTLGYCQGLSIVHIILPDHSNGITKPDSAVTLQ